MIQSNPLINKISPVSVSNVMNRHRLFSLLHHEPPTTTFWITGPGGSGKTTLVASYLSHENLPAIWYQVDALDKDPATFFYYFGQVASTRLSPSEPPLPLLTPEYLPNIEIFFLRYFENLYQRLKPGTWIVFDNFQDAPEDSRLIQILSVAIQQAPPHVILAILSRNAPPQVIAKFQANRVVKPIFGNQLTFTSDEFASFIESYRYGIGKEEIGHLYRLTQGWIAGAILWLLYNDNCQQPLQISSAMPPESIFDYFAAEILEKFEGDTRQFLLQTAFLPSMTAAMARKLTGVNHAESLVQTLYRKNCFIEKRLMPDVSYQYHPLFRRFLLLQAEQEFPVEAVHSLQSQAAAILTEQGLVEEAVELYVQAQRHDRIEGIIFDQAQSLINQGRHTVLLEWINRLGQEHIDQNPYLLFWKGMALLAMNPFESSRICTRAYKLFAEKNDFFGQVLSWSAAVNVLFLLRQTFSSLDSWIHEGERLGRLLPDNCDPNMEGRLAAGMLMAIVLRNQGHEDLQQWQDRCEMLLEVCSDLQVIIDLMKNLCTSYTCLGQLHKLLNCEIKFQFLQHNEQMPPLGRILINYMLANCYVSRGALQECEQVVSNSLDLTEMTGIHIFDFSILTFLIYPKLVTGDLKQVQSLLGQLKKKLSPAALWDQANYHALEAWHAIQANQLVQAKTAITSSVEMAVFCESPFPIALSNLLQSQLYLELGEPEKAFEILENVRSDSMLRGNKLIRHLVDLSCADCAFMQGRIVEAESYCRAAMAFVKEEGTAMPFGLSNRRLGEVCARALDAGIEEDAVIEMVKRWRLAPPEPEKTGDRWPWQIRIYTFDRFAVHCDGTPLALSAKTPKKLLELLALLICCGQTGISRERIADQLWPDSDGDLAMQTLNTTLHRLRKLLVYSEVVEQRDGQLSLNRRLCWCDCWRFQWLAQQIISESKPTVIEDMALKALGLYRGSFMPDYMQSSIVISYLTQMKKLRAEVVAAAMSIIVNKNSNDRLKKKVLLALQDEETANITIPIFSNRCRKNLDNGASAQDISSRCKNLLAEIAITNQG